MDLENETTDGRHNMSRTCYYITDNYKKRTFGKSNSNFIKQNTLTSITQHLGRDCHFGLSSGKSGHIANRRFTNSITIVTVTNL